MIGVRPGEKIHEEMVSENEGINTLEIKGYIILNNSELKLINKIKKYHKAKIKNGFSYVSNLKFNLIDEKRIKKFLIIKKKIKLNFNNLSTYGLIYVNQISNINNIHKLGLITDTNNCKILRIKFQSLLIANIQ